MEDLRRASGRQSLYDVGDCARSRHRQAQVLPHDAWDFDSAVGEFVSIDRDGKKYYVHPNKSGYIFVYDRADAKIENVYNVAKASNFVKTIDPKTGELQGRRDMTEGKQTNRCPAIAAG